MTQTAKEGLTVIGACNVDLITYVERFPKPGETIRGITTEMGFGGKGANQAIQAAKLGAHVRMISKLGQDLYGKNTIENFQKNGVDSSQVFTVTDPSTQRISSHHRGNLDRTEQHHHYRRRQRSVDGG